MMHNLRDQLNIAIVFITDDLALAKYFAWEGRIGVTYLGRMVEIGPTPGVIGNPAPYTRADLGHSRSRSGPDAPQAVHDPGRCDRHAPVSLKLSGRCAYLPTQIEGNPW